MTDIALQMIDQGEGRPSLFDLALNGADLATDDSLQTAVIISLFTDRRAETDDTIPDGTDNRRGWWTDTLADIEGDRIGSRLWLLAREKQLPDVLARAKEYAEEALQWLIDDGVASAVSVLATSAGSGWLNLHIKITRPQGDSEYRFNTLWEHI
ncbi:phage GP46 family protein [Candidatus Vondammii sp. HM_W22]|uniref:phage GP46 family protein n=1 Tax=Candidatus Vondammii sp. HM_W22 TaxID=2687299 RepID=UPI001F1409DA|nr:phage GP46 family protein [Candidatus Vondammii sp. HM_W22]